MNTVIKLIVFTAVLGFLYSCSPLTPYTPKVQSEYGIADEDIEKIQFYLSKDIIFYRAESGAQTATEGGELVISSDRNTEQVVIEKGTKGILEKKDGSNRIAIRFEPGDEKYLYFVSNSFGGKYVLDAKWQNNVGELKYGGHTYYATSSSRDAFLQFKVRKFQRDNSSKRKVGGMEVN